MRSARASGQAGRLRFQPPPHLFVRAGEALLSRRREMVGAAARRNSERADASSYYAECLFCSLSAPRKTGPDRGPSDRRASGGGRNLVLDVPAQLRRSIRLRRPFGRCQWRQLEIGRKRTSFWTTTVSLLWPAPANDMGESRLFARPARLHALAARRQGDIGQYTAGGCPSPAMSSRTCALPFDAAAA